MLRYALYEYVYDNIEGTYVVRFATLDYLANPQYEVGQIACIFHDISLLLSTIGALTLPTATSGIGPYATTGTGYRGIVTLFE